MELAEDLKKAVLKLAMQGKLSEQKETDNDVDELLSKINKGKERLISEGLISKEKTVSEISEEEIPFDIPTSWRWKKVGDVLGIARGGSPRPINSYLTNSEDGYNWIKIGDSEIGGKYINSTAQKIKKEGLHKTRLVHKGDLLLSNSMSFGRPYILNIDGCIHDGWLVLHDYTESLNKEFLYYLFSSSILKEQFSGKVSGAVVKNLNSDKVADTVIPIPPIEEQQRIVDKLNQILPLIDEYGKEEDELIALGQKFPEEMKKSVLQAAMQGKLTEQLENDSSVDELLKKIAEEKAKLIEEGKIKREKPLAEITDDEIPFEIPENWRWERWGNLSNSIQYGYNASAVSSGYAKMVRISDIQDNKILWDTVPYCEISETEYEKYKLNNTDLLFARTGGTVGKSVLVSGLTERSVYAGYLIRSHYNQNLNPQYLKYFMECPLYWSQLTQGTTKGCQPNCNGQTLSQMIVPLPPIEEQQRIVEKLNSILPIIDSMAVYGTKKKAGRPKQEEALAFINTLLGTKKSAESKPVSPEILELTAKAKEELPTVVKKYAELMGVTYNRITIRHQTTRWGSCTKTGNLNFNCLLMKMPENVRDYVIVHELAHRKEMNHSAKFWAIVTENCSGYKDAKKWLKDNGTELLKI